MSAEKEFLFFSVMVKQQPSTPTESPCFSFTGEKEVWIRIRREFSRSWIRTTFPKPSIIPVNILVLRTKTDPEVLTGGGDLLDSELRSLKQTLHAEFMENIQGPATQYFRRQK